MYYSIRRISVTLSATHAIFTLSGRLVIVDEFALLVQLARIMNYEYTLYQQAPHRHNTDVYSWSSMNSDNVPDYYKRRNVIPASTDGYAILMGIRVVFWSSGALVAQAVHHFINQEHSYWRED